MDFNIGSMSGWVSIIITVVLSLAAAISSAMLYVYIYYSWVRRKNEEKQQGFDAARKVFNKAGNTNVKIVSSLLIFKWWNYSKRKNVFKLRPWTHNRTSYWTLMDASSQAYLADVKFNKKDKHFSMYTFPLILRIISIVCGALAIIVAIIAPFVVPGNEDYKGKDLILPYLLIAAAVWVIGSAIGSLNKSKELRKNLLPMFKGIISDSEARSIKRVLVFKWMFAWSSLILSITSIPTLFAEIISIVSKL